MKRASYRHGVEILALNGDYDLDTVEALAADMTVDLLATLFAVEPERVARDVLRVRAAHEATKKPKEARKPLDGYSWVCPKCSRPKRVGADLCDRCTP